MVLSSANQIINVADMEEAYFHMIYWLIFCFFSGRSVGRTIDIQYRDPKGKPRFITIPSHRKWIFSFKYSLGNEVVKEGVQLQILAYVFCVLQLALIILTHFSVLVQFAAEFSDLLGIGYVLGSACILVPVGVRHDRNVCIAYDCDWISFLQHALTVLPKRRCTIVEQLNPSTYMIVLGRFSKRRYTAKSSVPRSVGDRLFALHTWEEKAPFWTLRDH